MNTLEQNITEFGLLAEMAYLNLQDNIGLGTINKFVNKNGINRTLNNKYKVLDYINTENGLQAYCLKNENGEYIIAFRGTDDLSIDPFSWYGENTSQYKEARNFVEKIINNPEINNSNLTFTGHSLGGILTAQLSVKFGVKGYAYNPFGANLLEYKNYKKYADVIKEWSDNNIYTISYQDEGLINGDILSNLVTDLFGAHIGKYIPIFGKNQGSNIFDGGHSINTLNTAIAEYNNIVQKFDNSCRYEDITQMYLSTAIIHGSGYKKVRDEFKKLGILNENGANDKIANNSLHLEVIAKDTDATSIFSGSNLSTPALYALVNLNPFIVSNINSNAYSELERYKDEYSKNYVSDKAKMFKALMDTPKVGSYYDDYETGKKISYYTSVTDPDSTDEYNLTDTAYTFGTNKNDIVTASVGKANRIYTLAGDYTIKLTGGSNYKFINLNLLVA